MSVSQPGCRGAVLVLRVLLRQQGAGSQGRVSFLAKGITSPGRITAGSRGRQTRKSVLSDAAYFMKAHFSSSALESFSYPLIF